MNMKRSSWIAAGLLVLLVVMLFTVRMARVRARETTPPLSVRPVVVRVAPVSTGCVNRTMTLEGKVRAAISAELAPEVTAQVIERLAEPGDDVSAGQPLIRLDPVPFAEEVMAKEAELAAARADAEAAAGVSTFQQAATDRDRVLFEGDAISREALESSEAMLMKSKAAETAARMRVTAIERSLHTARDQLSKTDLTAPWKGGVVEVRVSPGDLAQRGQPVVRLVRDGAYRVVAQLPQEVGRSLRPGGPVRIESGHERIKTSVSRIAAGLDRSGLITVEVDFDAPPFGLSDGASVRLSVVVGSAEGIVVPRGSLLEGERGTYAFRVHDGNVESLPVRALLRGDRGVVVEGPLAPGDRVVVEHPSILMTLSDGLSVSQLELESQGEGT